MQLTKLEIQSLAVKNTLELLKRVAANPGISYKDLLSPFVDYETTSGYTQTKKALKVLMDQGYIESENKVYNLTPRGRYVSSIIK